MRYSRFHLAVGYILCAIVWDSYVPTALAAAELKVYHCPYWSTPEPAQHERFVDVLNGKKILFIGDSVTRFQYLSLAAFLVKGLCSDKQIEERRVEYGKLYYVSDWDAFYIKSSEVLSTEQSSETCICNRDEYEFRSFEYQDEQANLEPTHVVMNYGLWLIGTAEDCGQHKGADSCPYVPEVCEFLTGEHPFRVMWQTTTPRQAHSHTPLGELTEQHHLHIPRVCKLASDAFINRGELLHALEPDNEKRKELYHDDAHFTPAPYHAFNGYLVEMIAGQDLRHGNLSSGGEHGEETDEEQSADKETDSGDEQREDHSDRTPERSSDEQPEQQQQAPANHEQFSKETDLKAEVHQQVAEVQQPAQGTDRLRAVFG